jgi:hypothetical protein
MADGGIGIPGRHLAQSDGLPDGTCPWAGGGVIKQRHWTYFAGTMAGLAVLLEDWEDVLVEVGSVGGEERRCAYAESEEMFQRWQGVTMITLPLRSRF